MSMKYTLVIDDDAIVREAVKDILELIDINVLEAQNGDEGLALFEGQPHDIPLIIIDMIMPGMNGYETLQKLKGVNSQVKVIMSSGMTDSPFDPNSFTYQPDEYLHKPYELDTLISSVKKFYAVDSEV